MEPKIERLEIAKRVMAFLRHIDWSASTDEWKYERIADILERVPSSPASRLEFQLDRISETEWSADTWLVLPNGKREVLGWIPCDSQEDADEKVANLTKLYAEAVPSSPVAPWAHVPAQYKSGRWAVDYDDKNSVFFVHCNGHRVCDAEDSEVASAICSVYNTGSPAAPMPPQLEDHRCAICGWPLVEGDGEKI